MTDRPASRFLGRDTGRGPRVVGIDRGAPGRVLGVDGAIADRALLTAHAQCTCGARFSAQSPARLREMRAAHGRFCHG